jgi:hypothetical protein
MQSASNSVAADLTTLASVSPAPLSKASSEFTSSRKSASAPQTSSR